LFARALNHGVISIPILHYIFAPSAALANLSLAAGNNTNTLLNVLYGQLNVVVLLLKKRISMLFDVQA